MDKEITNLLLKHRDRIMETIKMLEIYRMRGMNVTISEAQEDLNKQLAELNTRLGV